MSNHRGITAGLVLAAAAIGVIVGVWVLPQASGLDKTIADSGVCTLSHDAVVANSKVGKMATDRLQSLTQQARNQIASQRKALAQRAQKLEKASGSLAEDELKKHREDLDRRRQELQRKSRRIDARLSYTRATIDRRIDEVVDPLVGDHYKDQGCKILLDGDSVLKSNDTKDLTSDITAALNDKVTKVNFDLLSLPEQKSGTEGNESEESETK